MPYSIPGHYSSVRKIIQQKRQQVQQLRGSADQLVLIIKPSSASSFKNFADITDEVTINNIRRYYFDDLSAFEIRQIGE